MTPAEIAKKLTPAQVRALRDPSGCGFADWQELADFDFFNPGRFALLHDYGDKSTDLGRAVLAELERMGK
ncbi:MAG: hypothetical protein EBT13_12770 [Rhodobacteraceae bacterium]|nr:hypothetical protein [Paracoccaceae bacterium]